MDPIAQGSLDKSSLAVYPNGVLTLDRKHVVFMRVKLIARLCADIMQEFPIGANRILREAGRELGRDYVADWLLMRMPIMGAGRQLPPNIVRLGQEYEQIENRVDAGSLDQNILEREKAITLDMRAQLVAWLRQQSENEIKVMWQQAMNLDVYGGWGSAKLVDCNRGAGTATIQVVSSFLARPAHVWYQHGIKGKHVCALLAGYLGGEAIMFLANESLQCMETKCRLEGAEMCTFAVAPPEDLPK